MKEGEKRVDKLRNQGRFIIESMSMNLIHTTTNKYLIKTITTNTTSAVSIWHKMYIDEQPTGQALLWQLSNVSRVCRCGKTCRNQRSANAWAGWSGCKVVWGTQKRMESEKSIQDVTRTWMTIAMWSEGWAETEGEEGRAADAGDTGFKG